MYLIDPRLENNGCLLLGVLLIPMSVKSLITQIPQLYGNSS